MSWLRSSPTDGIAWRDVLGAGAIAAMLPALIGLGLIASFWVLSAVVESDLLLDLWIAGMVLALSPLLIVPGLILGLLLSGILVRQGWFGWLPAAALGAGLGGIIGTMAEFPLGWAFGLCDALIFRTVLGRLRPMG